MKDKDDDYSLDQLSDCYQKLGFIEKLNSNFNEALKWYLLAKEIKKDIAKKTNNSDDLAELASVCIGLGNCYAWVANEFEVRKNFDEAYEIVASLCNLPNGIDYGALYVRLMLQYGDFFFDLGLFDDSGSYYSTAHITSQGLVANTAILSNVKQFILASLQYGKLYRINGDDINSKEKFSEALNSSREIYNICGTNETKKLLVTSLCELSDYAENYNEFLTYHNEAAKIIKTIKDCDNIEIIKLISYFYSKMASLFNKYEKEEQAENYYISSYIVIKREFEKNNSDEYLELLSRRYYQISLYYYKKKKYNAANKTIKEAYKYISKLIERRNDFHTVKLYTNIIIELCNFMVDNIDFLVNDVKEKAEYLKKIYNTPQTRKILYDAYDLNMGYYKYKQNVELVEEFRIKKESIKEIILYYKENYKDLRMIPITKNLLYNAYM